MADVPTRTRPGIRWASAGAALALLAACSEAPPEVVEKPRPIKTFVVSEAAGGTLRKYTGVIEASTTAALSFPIGGTVQEVLFSVGDTVAQGDILARLDSEPVDLEVQAAEADLQRALADLAAKQGDLDRQKTLFDKDWVAAAAVEKAQAAYDSAVSGVDYARSRVALAKRNLDKAVMVAPYDGVIAERLVEPFQDVAAGQKLFSLNAVGTLQAAFSVPETAINRVALGEAVSIEVPSSPTALDGRITEIASTASSGNAYLVKASLVDPTDQVRPGMTATVTATDVTSTGEEGYFVPLSAITAGDGGMAGSVFKYDAAAGVVRKQPITATGVQDNLVVVSQGVAPGDVIASAGVSFLMDGESVLPLSE
jgi:RND family efflux transporter MFP subunit